MAAILAMTRFLRRRNTQNTHASVAYCVLTFPSLSQTFVLNEARALHRRGFLAHIFAMTLPEEAPIHPGAEEILTHVSYVDTQRNGYSDIVWMIFHHPFGLFKAIRFLHQQRDPKVLVTVLRAMRIVRLSHALGIRHLHAHLAISRDAATIAAMIGGLSFSFTAHAQDIYVSNRFLGRSVASARFIVTVCEYNRRLLAEYLPAGTTGKIHVVRPFLDLDLFRRDAQSGPGDAKEDTFHIATVCRLVPKKGVEVLLEALHLLARRGIAFQATIVGDGPERTRLQETLDALGLAGKVSMPGSRNSSAVCSLMRGIDLFVLASRKTPDGDSDATPTVLGEAMAMGLPVVSTRVSGIPEIVPEEAGILVEPGNAYALADAISYLSGLPPHQLASMGRRGRAFVLAHWNGNIDVDRLIHLFEYRERHVPGSDS